MVLSVDVRNGAVHADCTGTVCGVPAGSGYSLNRQPVVIDETATLRRLTPLETLRLQGFDDDWFSSSGAALSDVEQYRMIGNSWAVPCAAWIFERIIGWDELARN